MADTTALQTQGSGSARFSDGLTSFVSGLGMAQHDKVAASAYIAPVFSEQQLQAAYTTSWAARKIVDIPVKDALRKWRAWQGDANQISALEAEEKRLGIQRKLMDAKIKARLFGGAAILIGTGDEDPMEPLDPASVKKGGIAYLTVLKRSELSDGDLDEDVLSPTYGAPSWYEVAGKAGVPVRVHPSRFVIMSGHAKDGWTSTGWGESVLSNCMDAVKNFDGAAGNVAHLTFEASVDVLGIPEFTQTLAGAGGAGNATENTYLQRLALTKMAKSTTRMLMMDGAETYDRKQISFGTLPELLMAFGQLAAAAGDIPITRFLGSAPGGLSQEGSGSERNYHEAVQSIQTMEIEPAITLLDECTIWSALGSRPAELWYTWNELRVLSEEEQADIGVKLGTLLKTFTESGAFVPEEARAAFGNALIETGVLPGLEAAMAETGEAKIDLGGDDTDPDADLPA